MTPIIVDRAIVDLVPPDVLRDLALYREWARRVCCDTSGGDGDG